MLRVVVQIIRFTGSVGQLPAQDLNIRWGCPRGILIFTNEDQVNYWSTGQWSLYPPSLPSHAWSVPHHFKPKEPSQGHGKVMDLMTKLHYISRSFSLVNKHGFYFKE